MIEDVSGQVQGNSEGSQPTETKDDAETRNDFFWSIEGDFIHRHHIKPRVQLHVPKEESFPIPLKYIDESRTTHTSLDVLQERRINDCWHVDATFPPVSLLPSGGKAHSTSWRHARVTDLAHEEAPAPATSGSRQTPKVRRQACRLACSRRRWHATYTSAPAISSLPYGRRC